MHDAGAAFQDVDDLLAPGDTLQDWEITAMLQTVTAGCQSGALRMLSQPGHLNMPLLKCSSRTSA
jgi:hypothetical protein